MEKRLIWLSWLVICSACGEDVLAPGACPDFCPPQAINIIDTIFIGAIERDSSFRGYVPPHLAQELEITSGGLIESRAVIRFVAYDSTFRVGTNDRPIVATDSFRLDLQLLRRSASDSLELIIHRLPVSVDSSTTFADVADFFDDSTEIGVISIPDTVSSGAISATLAADVFPTLEADSQVVAIGLQFRATSPGFADVSAQVSLLSRFVQVDSTQGVIIEGTQTEFVSSDLFVATDAPPLDPASLAVGGSPSARALLRVDLPDDIILRSAVVRATVMLIPTEPVIGAPGDTILINAEALAADFGPKSPIIPLPADSAANEQGSRRVPVGTMDTVKIDITHIVRPWRRNLLVPRSFMLRASPEGSSVGELRFGSSESSVIPVIQITYIPTTFGEN